MFQQGFGPDDEGVFPTLREYGSHQIQFANPSLGLPPTLEISFFNWRDYFTGQNLSSGMGLGHFHTQLKAT